MKKSVGDLLREARNQKGLALQTIERMTGIATHHLLAIELDQFSLVDADKLEDFLRTYAETVGLSFEDLGYVSNQDNPLSDSPEPLIIKTSFDDLVSEDHPDYVPQPVISSSLTRSGRNTHEAEPEPTFLMKLLKLILAILILVLVAFATKIFYTQYMAPKATVQVEETATTSSSTVATSSQVSSSSSQASSSSTSSSSSETPATQLTVAGGGDQLTVAVATKEKPVKVQISLSGAEKSWISMASSSLGETGTMLDAEQSTYEATINEDTTQTTLYLGITQGVSIKVNGQNLDLSALTSTANSSVIFNIQ